jgi:hypothetical protein
MIFSRSKTSWRGDLLIQKDDCPELGAVGEKEVLYVVCAMRAHNIQPFSPADKPFSAESEDEMEVWGNSVGRPWRVKL